MSPSFRPPSRYLIGLSALEEDVETARLYAARLIEDEPDFNALQLIEDDDYPAGFLRRLSPRDKDKLRGVALDL